MASTRGTQKPSCSDAQTNTSAPRKYDSSSSGDTEPVIETASLRPSSAMKADSAGSYVLPSGVPTRWSRARSS